MAEDTGNKTEDTTDSKTAAVWTVAKDTILINALIEQKAAGNWGDNNPKKVTWSGVREVLVGSETCSGRGREDDIIHQKSLAEGAKFSLRLVCMLICVYV